MIFLEIVLAVRIKFLWFYGDYIPLVRGRQQIFKKQIRLKEYYLCGIFFKKKFMEKINQEKRKTYSEGGAEF